MASIPRIALTTLSKPDLTGFEQELRIRQVVDLAKQTPIHALGNVGNAGLLAWIFWYRRPQLPIALWLALFVLFSGFQLWRWWRKREWPEPKQVSRRSIRRTTVWALVAGLMWAAAALFTFPPHQLALQLLILMLVGGLGGGAVASMAPQPIACLAFMTPPLVTVLVLIFTRGDGPISHIIVAMGVLYLAVLVATLASGFSSFVAIVHTRVDRNNLETRLLQMELAASTEANRAKSMFLANMSHELRTPLSAVIGFSELIHDQPLGAAVTEQYRDYANDIREAGQHLLRIVNDVLDISKIEAGKLVLNDSEFEIAPMVASAFRLVAPAAGAAGVELSADLPPDLPALIADERYVRQILVNLLSNAIKFSRRDGKAEVGASLRADGALALWVKDNGIGISGADLATVRQPFQQAEGSFSRMHEGAGLGLSLVEGFMALHGGQLELESEPQVGTTATIVFPAARVAQLPVGQSAAAPRS